MKINKQNFFKLFIISLIASLVSACGFHLRGHRPLPKQLSRIYFQSNRPYSPFSKTLKTSLQDAGATLVANPQSAQVILVINSVAFTHSQLSSTLDDRNAQINYYYTVNYAVKTPKGRFIITPTNLSLNKTLLNTAVQYTNSNAVTDLQAELRNDAIFRLIARLSPALRAWKAKS